MSQIFNRIKNILKTNYYFNKSNNDFDFNNEDEELKRIIDELAYDYHNHSSDNKYKSYEETTKNDKLSVSFEVLGLTYTDDFNKIKIAYKKQISNYHPDRAERLNPEEREKYLHKAQEINAAYSYLKKHFGK